MNEYVAHVSGTPSTAAERRKKSTAKSRLVRERFQMAVYMFLLSCHLFLNAVTLLNDWVI